MNDPQANVEVEFIGAVELTDECLDALARLVLAHIDRESTPPPRSGSTEGDPNNAANT